jgi:nucleoside-diphosphate-sugar epimerase
VARLLVGLAINEWSSPSQSVYNVGTGNSITVMQLASLTHKLTRSENAFQPIFQSERAGDIERSVASITAIENDLHWKPEIQLEEGLRQLIKVKTS